MLTKLMFFLKDDSGATAIEYGLIAALVSVAAIAALGALGDSLVAVFEEVSSKLDGAITPGLYVKDPCARCRLGLGVLVRLRGTAAQFP